MSEDRTSNTAVRSYLLFSRATEQTALVLSAFFGAGERRRGKQEQRRGLSGTPTVPAIRRKIADKWALTSMLGVLSQGPWNARISHRYPQPARASDDWGPANARLGKFASQGEPNEFDIDLVVCPCEGMRDLLSGYHGGSASVLAGGEKGAFKDPVEFGPPAGKADLWYFVVVGRHEGNDDLYSQPWFIGPKARTDLCEWISSSGILDGFLDGLKTHRSRLLLATTAIDQPTELLTSLRYVARLRMFHGSAVAAALTAHVPSLGVDAFAALVNPASALLIAAAAKATHKAFLALPCHRGRRKGKEAKGRANVGPEMPLVRADDLVPGTDVFVIATGITENLLLRGVRFGDHGSVHTETICLRSATDTRRTIRQTHNLERRRFHLLRGRPDYHHLPDAYDREAFTTCNYNELLNLLEAGNNK